MSDHNRQRRRLVAIDEIPHEHSQVQCDSPVYFGPRKYYFTYYYTYRLRIPQPTACTSAIHTARSEIVIRGGHMGKSQYLAKWIDANVLRVH